MDCTFADSHDVNNVNVIRDKMAGRGVSELDFLFIDADHTYEGVKRDYELYSLLVRSGGLIGFHDIIHHTKVREVGVDRFWNELKAQGLKVREIVENPDQGWAGIGLVEKQ